MRIPVGFGWVLSLKLNKGKYSSCLNPHILLCRPGVCGYGVTFPPEWRVWNVELSPVKWWRNRKWRRGVYIRRGIYQVFSVWKFSLFVFLGGEVRFYWAVPFFKTQSISWHSPLAAVACFGVCLKGVRIRI